MKRQGIPQDEQVLKTQERKQDLIQLIQSLLTSKQAAQTTLVSKSWLSAFITRPNLDFNEADFLRSDVPFSTHVLYTITRHVESNLKIHSFCICVQSKGQHFHPLIRRALENGATHLSVQSQSGYFYVPKDVLQYETLVSLTLKGAVFSELDQGVTCSRLESLFLRNIVFKSRDMVWRIISTCPLIQNLSLSCVSVYRDRLVDFDTSFLRDLSSSFPVLKVLTLRMVSPNRNKGDMLISSRSLERLEIKLLEDSGNQGIRFDLPSIRKLTFEGPVVPLLSLPSNLCVDENISTAQSNHLNQVRANIKFY